MFTLTLIDPTRWPDVHLINVDSAGHFDVIIPGWRCVDGSVYPPSELAAGAGWRDMLADLFRDNADDSASPSIEPDLD